MLGIVDPRLSGGTISFLAIGDALLQLGHEVEMISRHEPPKWASFEVPWQRAEDTRSALDPSVDAVLTGCTGIESALESGVGTVGHLCFGYEPHLWPSEKEWVAHLYHLPAQKLVIAEHLQRTLEREEGIESVVIGTPIPLGHFAAERSGAREEAGRRKRVLTVGPEPRTPLAPVPFKGIAHVLEIVARARRAGAELDLVRLTPYGDELSSSEEIDELHTGVEPTLTPQIYRSCDVYLSASTPAEGLGMPAVEAACSGLAGVLPTIPSYLGIDGLDQAALFYPAGDLDAAADQLRRLLADPELLSRLGEAGPTLRFERQFDPLAVAGRIVSAIEKACS